MSQSKKPKTPSRSSRKPSAKENSSQKTKGYDTKGSLSQIVEEELGKRLKNKVILKRVGFSIKPELKQEFEDTASQLGMNLTEFLRRAGRVAQKNPDLLLDSEVEEAENAYKDEFKPSRWTYEGDN